MKECDAVSLFHSRVRETYSEIKNYYFALCYYAHEKVSDSIVLGVHAAWPMGGLNLYELILQRNSEF